MPSNKDPRKVINARVHTKATHLTSLAECSRLYGSLAKSKLVDGIVIRVIVDRSMKRAHTFLETNWALNAHKTIFKCISLYNVVARVTTETARAESSPTAEQRRIRELVNQESWDQSEILGDENPVKIFEGEVEEVFSTVLASSHDVDWHAGKVEIPINGPIVRRYWSVRTCVGETVREGSGVSSQKPYFYFLTMFPHKHLSAIVSLTNVELNKRNEKTTTPGEVLKFFGILILMTRWEYGSTA